jgi:hypothetical protein
LAQAGVFVTYQTIATGDEIAPNGQYTRLRLSDWPVTVLTGEGQSQK